MSGTARPFPSRRVLVVAYLMLFLGACAVAFYLILPIRAGQVGFDAAASVVYFDRLIQGRHLEAFLGATPKPLLTLVYGVVYHLFGDWRPISWLAIAMLGLSAVLTTILVRRVGGLQAAAFAGVAVIGSQALLKDVALSYAVVWAFAGCLLAGIAITVTPPRYGWAGVALGLAALARFEVLLVLGTAIVVLVSAGLWARHRHTRGPARPTWLVLIGLVAVPIQFAHDWLLTGNALYSESVPVAGSVGTTLTGPLSWVGLIAQHVLQMGILVGLALIGIVVLGRRRQWGILVGLAAMGPGVAAFLVFLAFRRIYISSRYLDPIDLAVVIAAAIGFGSITIPTLQAAASRMTAPAARLTILAVAASLVAVLASAPFAPTNKAVRLTIRGSLDIQRDAREALPTVRRAIAAIPAVTDWPGPGPGRLPALVVPTLLIPEFVQELGVPIGQVGGPSPTRLKTDGTYPIAGQLIFHDQRSEPDPAFDFLEVSKPTTIGRIIITPLLADPGKGYWVDRIDPAP